MVATHSPLLMSLPGALIYELSDEGIAPVDYDDVRAVALWRAFLAAPERMLDRLLADTDPEDDPDPDPADER